MYAGSPGGSDDKESTYKQKIQVQSLEKEMACNPLQYSCLENPYGQRSLVGYSPWGRKAMDTTQRLSTAQNGR